MRIRWWTVALQALNFLVLVWLLRRFLWRPVQAVLEQRRAEVDRAMADAAAARQAAETLRRDIEAERAAIVGERERALEQAHAEAAHQRAASLEKAQREADDLRAEARHRLDAEREEVEKEIQDRAAGLAVTIASRLLAAAGPGPDELLLEQALVSLHSRAVDERVALAPPPAMNVQVASAAPLGEEARRRCRDELALVLGRSVDVAFAEDPALLAGVEIHFPDVVLRHSWREALAGALEELHR